MATGSASRVSTKSDLRRRRVCTKDRIEQCAPLRAIEQKQGRGRAPVAAARHAQVLVEIDRIYGRPREVRVGLGLDHRFYGQRRVNFKDHPPKEDVHAVISFIQNAGCVERAAVGRREFADDARRAMDQPRDVQDFSLVLESVGG